MKKLVRITSVPLSMEKLLGNQLSYMNEFYEVTAVSSDAPQLKIVADQLGIRHHAVEMTRTITPLKDLKSIYCMYRFFRKVKPDIVHSHTPKAGLVGMIAAFFAGVPVRMHTVAGLPLLESTGVKRIVLSQVERLIYGFCTKVYPNSLELKKIILQENFCSASKLEVIGNGSSNGIDLSHFDPDQFSSLEKRVLKKKLGIAENDFVFIFLGRIVKDKGINELVSAFKSLADLKVSSEDLSTTKGETEGKIIPLQFGSEEPTAAIVGDTTRRSYYNGRSVTGLRIRHRLGKVINKSDRRSSSYASSNKPELYGNVGNDRDCLYSPISGSTFLFPNIKLLLVGPMEQHLNPILSITLSEIENNPQIITTRYVQDVRPYLSISNCLILPSYREGFPNVVLQAGAMNLPSIVSDINGCNEIIADGINGHIVPAKSEESLRKAMMLVLTDKELTKKMRSCSRKIIIERYSHQKIWAELRREYDRFLEK